MFIKSTGITVVIDDLRPVFTNGDVIKGHIYLRAKSSYSPIRVRLWLKCEEIASITISDASLGYEALEHRRWLNQPVKLQFHDARRAPITPNTSEYIITLHHGEHKIPFTFQIPLESENLPGSCSVTPRSGVFWYIECETIPVHKPGSRRSTGTRGFEMIPSVSRLSQTPTLRFASTKKAIDVYHPGFTYHKWQLSTKLSTFRSKQSKFHTRCVLKITEVLAQCGLQPGNPCLLDAIFSLEVSDPNAAKLLFLTQVELVLKQTFTATIKRHYKHSEYRYLETTLLSLDDIRWGLKEGEDKLREALSQTKTMGHFSPTRTDQIINVDYELGLMIKITNQELPNCSDKLWINVPVVVHPRLATPPTAEDDCLPAYSEHSDSALAA